MRVQLFGTCLVDALFPEVGEATVKLLRHFGAEVDYPAGQTCCGQPAFNAGYRAEAAAAARHFLDIFAATEGPIVTPSGSCAAMVKHHYPALLQDEPGMSGKAAAVAGRIYELSQFLVGVLRAHERGFAGRGRITYHSSCHLTRSLGVREEPLALLAALRGAEIVPLSDATRCCGFGGMFMAKLPEISCALADEKAGGDPRQRRRHGDRLRQRLSDEHRRRPEETGEPGARGAPGPAAGGGAMSAEQTSLQFRANAARAINDPQLRAALRNATDTFGQRRESAFAALPDLEALRERASAIRLEVLNHLPAYLEQFTANASAAGAIVHRAADAAAARELVAGLLKARGVTMVAKSKSMVSEEIHLNPYLEAAGIEVVETDLGEYIIQLEHETPSHIIVPAIHKSRQQVGRLFAERLGIPYSDDPQVLTRTARAVLRDKFLAAGAGLSGANFGIAASGSLALFTNEGNGRMVTTLPPLHIAVLSIEKLLPSLRELPTFIRLLPRSATGQAITSYLSLITGTRRPGEATGAEELHIVLLDNGRSEILKGACREMLKCIRCGACMNVCPVYRTVGGHAYGWTYPGPMGLILTNLLAGMETSYPLVDASTLCGACVEVCPVKIPLVELILELRRRRVRDGFSGSATDLGMRLFARAASAPKLFNWGERLARICWPGGPQDRREERGGAPAPAGGQTVSARG